MDATLIIRLIEQDFKHNQLLHGIESLGFDHEGKHHLQIWDIVDELMNTKPSSNEWNDIYHDYLIKAAKEVFNPNANLHKLAKKCYQELLKVSD